MGNGDTVISQFPTVGTKVTVGSTVIAYTEEGESTMVSVPDLRNKTPDAVRSSLSSVGLNLKETGAYTGNEGVRASAQTPNAGDKVPMGTTITVTFSDTNTSE